MKKGEKWENGKTSHSICDVKCNVLQNSGELVQATASSVETDIWSNSLYLITPVVMEIKRRKNIVHGQDIVPSSLKIRYQIIKDLTHGV